MASTDDDAARHRGAQPGGWYGITSRTGSYRIGYAIAAPLGPVLRRLAPRYVTTTERLGQAMLRVARHGSPRRVLENADLT